MAGLIDQLLELLNEQAARYEDMLGLSLEKKDVIIANDIEALQKITGLENILVSQHQKLDKKRTQVMEDIAIVLNQDKNTLTVSEIIELLDGQNEQEPLREVRDRIKKTLEELSEANKQNSSLIGNAMDYIDYSLNVIRSQLHPELYMEELLQKKRGGI